MQIRGGIGVGADFFALFLDESFTFAKSANYEERLAEEKPALMIPDAKDYAISLVR